ncbi:MAG: MmgE/PrpD family protein [Syntrophorhabdaceae bacterium]|nr:MmgE/PrpD family protein [Syntrophorhabdaceae bacterium]
MDTHAASVSRKLAQHAEGFSYTVLSDQEIHVAKRAVLDMLACAIGAHKSDAGRIVRSVMEDQGGARESTMIGSLVKVPCANAALANGAMARYLDYNDTYFRTNGTLRFGIHSNELIPAALAVGERRHATGKDVIAAIALAYDLAARFIDASFAQNLHTRGWHYSAIAGFVVALSAGKLLGLSAEQLADAVGIAGVHGLTLDIIDAQGEPYNMTKNIGLPQVAQIGIIAALLAQKGFTGPARIIEGNKGFIQTVMGGVYDLEVLLAPRNEPALLEVHQKNLAAEHTTQGALNAVLELVREYDLRPQDIEHVKIEATTRTANHTGDYVKRFPTDKETADHSLYYLTAIAIVDRTVGPGQYTADRFTNPVVLSLIDKVTVEANTDLDDFVFAGIAHISTKDGRRLTRRIDYPKGNSLNPMTDEELVKKFEGTALQFLDKNRSERIADCVFSLEQLEDIGELMANLSFT